MGDEQVEGNPITSQDGALSPQASSVPHVDRTSPTPKAPRITTDGQHQINHPAGTQNFLSNGLPTQPRVTLMPHNPPKRTPYDRYRNKHRTPEAEPSTSLDPYRFTHQKLGVTADEFQKRVEDEVDELFKEIESSRRAELLESLPFERPISKDEYLRISHASKEPASGSRIGNYMWAADLGHCRFNFDFDFATDDISILNAYD